VEAFFNSNTPGPDVFWLARTCLHPWGFGICLATPWLNRAPVSQCHDIVSPFSTDEDTYQVLPRIPSLVFLPFRPSTSGRVRTPSRINRRGVFYIRNVTVCCPTLSHARTSRIVSARSQASIWLPSRTSKLSAEHIWYRSLVLVIGSPCGSRSGPCSDPIHFSIGRIFHFIQFFFESKIWREFLYFPCR
jgi:hypothetical protein